MKIVDYFQHHICCSTPPADHKADCDAAQYPLLCRHIYLTLFVHTCRFVSICHLSTNLPRTLHHIYNSLSEIFQLLKFPTWISRLK